MISVDICIFNVQLWKFSSINQSRENDVVRTFVKPCSNIPMHNWAGIILEATSFFLPYFVLATSNKGLATWMSNKQSQNGLSLFPVVTMTRKSPTLRINRHNHASTCQAWEPLSSAYFTEIHWEETQWEVRVNYGLSVQRTTLTPRPGSRVSKAQLKTNSSPKGLCDEKSSTLPAGLFPHHPRSRPHCNERSPSWMQITSQITNSWPQAPNQQFQDPHSPSGYWSHPLLQKSRTHTDAKTGTSCCSCFSCICPHKERHDYITVN